MLAALALSVHTLNFVLVTIVNHDSCCFMVTTQAICILQFNCCTLNNNMCMCFIFCKGGCVPSYAFGYSLKLAVVCRFSNRIFKASRDLEYGKYDNKVNKWQAVKGLDAVRGTHQILKGAFRATLMFPKGSLEFFATISAKMSSRNSTHLTIE